MLHSRCSRTEAGRTRERRASFAELLEGRGLVRRRVTQYSQRTRPGLSSCRSLCAIIEDVKARTGEVARHEVAGSTADEQQNV